MKNGNVAIMIIAMVVIVLLGGCAAPQLRQKNVLPVAPAPRVEVYSTTQVPVSQPMDQTYVGGNRSEADEILGGGQQLIGGYNENNTAIIAQQPPQPVAQLPPAARQSHQHTLYPVEGKAWLNECLTCGEKVGVSQRPQQPPPPQQQKESKKSGMLRSKIIRNYKTRGYDETDRYAWESPDGSSMGGSSVRYYGRETYEDKEERFGPAWFPGNGGYYGGY